MHHVSLIKLRAVRLATELSSSYRLSAEKTQKSRQKEQELDEEDADNEIMDLSDPEKITKERGGL